MNTGYGGHRPAVATRINHPEMSDDGAGHTVPSHSVAGHANNLVGQLSAALEQTSRLICTLAGPRPDVGALAADKASGGLISSLADSTVLAGLLIKQLAEIEHYLGG